MARLTFTVTVCVHVSVVRVLCGGMSSDTEEELSLHGVEREADRERVFLMRETVSSHFADNIDVASLRVVLIFPAAHTRRMTRSTPAENLQGLAHFGWVWRYPLLSSL